MKALKYLTYVGKLAGFVTALNVIPFVDPAVGADGVLVYFRNRCSSCCPSQDAMILPPEVAAARITGAEIRHVLEQVEGHFMVVFDDGILTTASLPIQLSVGMC